MKPRRAMVVSMVLSAVLACVEVVGPEAVVPTPVALDPPIYYDIWWAEVEECSGLQGPYDRIRWFQVPDVLRFSWKGDSVSGLWFHDHSIVLAGDVVGVGDLVRHEMLHDLLGSGSHPRYYFEQLCGDVVL